MNYEWDWAERLIYLLAVGMVTFLFLVAATAAVFGLVLLAQWAL